MRVLIIFMAGLFVPLVMKFQLHFLEKQVFPGVEISVMNALIEEGVIEPTVNGEYTSYQVGGLVGTKEEAEQVLARVESVSGVSRVEDNLLVRGWFRLSRLRGELSIEGRMPPEAVALIFGNDEVGLTKALQSDEGSFLSRDEALAISFVVERMLEREVGNFQLDWLAREVTWEGETVPTEEEELRELVAQAASGRLLQFEPQSFPSSYHFTSRKLSTHLNGEKLRTLQRGLLEGRIQFEEGSERLTLAGQEAVESLAKTIELYPQAGSFILGVAAAPGEEELARRQARVIGEALGKRGVSESRLEEVVFSETPVMPAGRGELLVK